MSELRQDLISRDWVIVSPERAIRPHEHPAHIAGPCPFCPGQEEMNPAAIETIEDEQDRWLLRVVPNKFPALDTHPLPQTRRGGCWSWPHAEGYGRHEVIIESRDHATTLGLMPMAAAQRVLSAYVSRFRTLAHEDSRLRQIIVFRNHGPRAGASLIHPHSQIIATPVVAPATRRRTLDEIAFFDTTGHCGRCHLIERERRSRTRMVLESTHFVTYAPFASPHPYQLEIVPRRHSADFGGIRRREVDDLTIHLSRILAALYRLLDDPSYNLVVTGPPLDLIHQGANHWYIEIIPRLTTPAGFEMGSGIAVNVNAPETSAAALREAVEATPVD